MKEWTFESAVKVVAEAILKSQLAKEVEINEEDADLLAKDIVTKLEED